MLHEERNFSLDHKFFYYQCWLPEGAPKAVLLIVHGLAEHSGRYCNIINHFVPLGYAVYGIDHLGHGKSDGTRVYVERFADYIDPLKDFYERVRLQNPGKPIFMFGHSMGGLITSAYLPDHQAGLGGAVISAPAVRVPENITPFTLFMSRVLSVAAPKAGLLGLDATGISRDPAVVQAYVSDPLVYTGKTTARLGYEMLQAMQYVKAEAGRIKLPVLILQGSADKIVDPRGARELYDAVGSADKTIHIYDGFYHESFNDPGHEQVLKDVEEWLQAHLPF